MKTKQQKGKRTTQQKAIIVVFALFFALLLYGSRNELKDTWELILGVDIKLLILLPIIQLLSYFCVANYYTSMFQIFKKNVSITAMYPMVLSIFFVEQVLPAGGSTGIAYINYALRNKVSHGVVTLIQLGRYAFNHMAYMCITAVVVVMLFFDSSVNKRSIIVLVGFLVFMAAYAVLGFYIIKSKKHINSVVKWVEKQANKLSKRFRGGKELINSKSLQKSLLEFHNGAEKIFEQKWKNLKPLGFMALSTLGQLLIVYLSFVAIGENISFPVVVAAFTFANFIGVLSVVPGDVGVHEVAMISALQYLGVQGSVAISATLIYRVFVKIIILAIGFVFYGHYIKPSQVELK